MKKLGVIRDRSLLHPIVAAKLLRARSDI